MELKRTPLFAIHRALGARLVEFGGWEMPVQYSSIIDEHLAVRNAAGLFDISHMGEVRIVGPQAREFLNEVLTNDTRKLAAGQGQYSLMCQEQGGVVDDLYVYCLAGREFLLVINASRIAADLAWLRQRWQAFPSRAEVLVEDASSGLGALAVQGPRVARFIDQVLPGVAVGGTMVARPSQLRKNQIAAYLWDGVVVWVARTGYTGEDGFEFITPNARLEPIWQKLLAEGQAHGLHPAGLGARDTLRTEVCYPLFGHELDEQTTPLEAGLGAFVAFEKGDFMGRAALLEQKAGGLKKKCVAFKMAEKSAPPRPRYPIWERGPQGRRLGEVTSGTQSPSLGCGIGLGYVPPEWAQAGQSLDIEIRGRRSPAEVAPKPLYRKPVTSAG